jgi:AcrR family transcriptional regulator
MTAKPTIREAQKALTRQRITDAARRLFYEQGYYTTSIDQIAIEAGASHPTFYLHFRDKEELLGRIAEEYAEGVREYAENFPSPKPTIEALRTWLLGLGAFLDREKAAFTIVSDLSPCQVTPPPAHRRLVYNAWKQALSRRAPAFAAGMRKGERSAEARAACELMIVEIIWAAAAAWAKKDPQFVDGAISIFAKHLYNFLRDPRFAALAGPVDASD